MSLPDVEMTVLGVRVELPGNQPLVLLQDPGTGTLVPIWVGAPEASAIALWQQGITPPRPMTHDLLVEVIAAVGTTLEAVRISSVEDAVFHAELVLGNGARVDSRASDAIACALRAGVPVLCAAEVLQEAGVDPDLAVEEDESGEDAGGESATGVPGPAERDAELNRFREFLDSVDPEDFADGGPEQS
ncbi:bifunctional nuclease family protein [Citricoccus sp. SGAir0253]|uniref:bifunctional nuclease family protein n=1 Tax=Citricoccus sp. SGAir0253 TaxID=2567881 RepID=UPI0010CD3183|nr:bifunctional nuclease family protein [Citricoccus sp. SGAir0253]QCU77816.1 bifunctional nuclease family protein [Citricoccus sp. SGAir0253]